MKVHYFILLLIAGLSACQSSRIYTDKSFDFGKFEEPPTENVLLHRVFLVGNTGDGINRADVLNTLRIHLDQAGSNSTTLFLGDQVPCCGLPDSGHAETSVMEGYLLDLVKVVQESKGNVFFLAGDRDWNGQTGSLEARKRQEQFIEGHLQRGNIFLPDNGFPGPEVIELEDGLTLILLDTQWWLSEGERAFGDAGSYDLDETSDFLLEMKEELRKRRNEKLLIVGHHPLVSNGAHGGYFSAKTHLTPLPVLGSIVPFYRRYIGNTQDLRHHRYAVFRQEMASVFQGRTLVYAAAHDRGLQYFLRGNVRSPQHHIISGGGGRGEYLAEGRGAGFVASTPGIMVLDYYRDNSIWLTAITPDEARAEGRVLFHSPIQPSAPDPEPEDVPCIEADALSSYKDSSLVVKANPDYNRAGPLKRLLRGKLYRELWDTPVHVPLMSLETLEGGLTPIRLSRQGQSTTLRVEAPDKKQYVIRSVDKTAGWAWSKEMRSTIALDFIQDQIAMFHPYGAFIIPPLADSIGVFHTNPRLFYMPDDPRLGLAREKLANKLVLFEERPDEDMSAVPGMGGATNVISSEKLFEKLGDDNDHRVDGRSFARARLFDMLIADWDRHPGQWRWGVFEPADSVGKIYRPVPRDRDAAFLKINGVIPTLVKYLFDPRYQPFEESYGYLKGLNAKALDLDRRFTAALTRQDWLDIADSMRVALSDEVIGSALRQWPEPIYEQEAEDFSRIMKKRRDQLVKTAARYYDKVLSPTVDIVGSHKHERFEVHRLNDRETEVIVFKTTKKGKIRKQIYQRTFFHDETQEIRLYGRNGNDQFVVHGDVNKSLLVIAVGGAGVDTFTDSSYVRRRTKSTHFYDSKGENSWSTGDKTRVIKTDDPAYNLYTIFGFKYDLIRPIGFFGSNRDEGLMLGSGVRITRHGFRKTPHAQLHILRASMASNTLSYSLQYDGHFAQVMNELDFRLAAQYLSPQTVRTFYGVGNETRIADRHRSFYRSQQEVFGVRPALEKEIEQGASLHVGPKIYYSKFRRDSTRSVGLPDEGVSPRQFEGQWYGGLEASLLLRSMDNTLNPRSGFRWVSTVDANTGLYNGSGNYGVLTSDLTLYLSLDLKRQVTFALRSGGSHVLGDFPFYVGSTLGSKTNLRGFAGTRFVGRSSFYQNAELRLEVLQLKSYIAIGSMGVLTFVDNGRVWADNESSRTWHQGYGGGLWFDLFDSVVISSTVGISKEDTSLNIGLGFSY